MPGQRSPFGSTFPGFGFRIFDEEVDPEGYYSCPLHG
jgi:hypothetical protein